MKMKLASILGLLAVALCQSGFSQGTAFTYQGLLNDSASPANGSYDLQFTVYDARSGGNVAAGPLTNSATAVSNGLFTVTLDFGNQFPGAARWLEIAVRTNGAAGFLTLSPRQALTPTPYSITAGNVISGGLASGAYGNVVNFNNAADQFTGSFTGNGANVTNVNAAKLAGLTAANFWQLGGNSASNGQFLGTVNNQPVDLWVNGGRGWRLDPGVTDGSHSNAVNIVGGSFANFVAPGVSGSTISGGGALNYNGAPGTNSVASDFGVIGGGLDNNVQSFANVSVIGGGFRNNIQSGANSSIIGGGAGNIIESNAFDSVIGGGTGNMVGSYDSTIGGGTGNIATNTYSTVVGGQGNIASGSSAVAGGDHSTASGQDSVALGHSLASAQYSTAMGFSVATGTSSTALGLSDATGDYSTAMGHLSVASAPQSTAMGQSTASGTNSTALGNSSATNSYAFAAGYGSLAGGFASTALGNSYASNDFSTAIGSAVANGVFSIALGGATANGDNSIALGGSTFFSAEADGISSFAAGAASQAVHDYSFVWSDGFAPIPYSTTGPNQFLIHANGGVGIGTNAPAAALHVASRSTGVPQVQITQQNASDSTRLRMSSGSNLGWEMDVAAGSTPQLQFWYIGAAGPRLTVDTSGNVTAVGSMNATGFNNTSDRNAKEHFAPVNPRELLDRVAALPITRWNFKNDSGTEHIGPMAQDFHAAFDVGPDDKHIATVDEGGVALAAIQGLNQKLGELEAELGRRNAENDDLKKRLEAVEKIIHSR